MVKDIVNLCVYI